MLGTRTTIQRWGWWGLAVAALAAVAQLTRYDHWHDGTGREYVWDRWTHRSCVFIVWRPSQPTVCRVLTAADRPAGMGYTTPSGNPQDSGR